MTRHHVPKDWVGVPPPPPPKFNGWYLLLVVLRVILSWALVAVLISAFYWVPLLVRMGWEAGKKG